MQIWTDDEITSLLDVAALYGYGHRAAKAAHGLPVFHRRTVEAIRWKLRILHDEQYPSGCQIPESSYPRYDEPLVMEGNALVLPDIEAPFHHTDFVQRCVDLAATWGISSLVLAGDFVHFDSLSAWGASWIAEERGQLSDDDTKALLEFVEALPKKYQPRGFEILGGLGNRAGNTPNLGRELAELRRFVSELTKVFRRVDFVLGNHEGRLLRLLNSPLFPADMLRLIEADHWRVAPYYYSLVESGGKTFRVTHPKTAAKYSAEKLAAKFQQHVLMAHSHAWRCNLDISGTFWAIQIGHCVDEARLPYAAQRDTPRDAHALGAAIIRDGYPWLLCQNTPWKLMEKMK